MLLGLILTRDIISYSTIGPTFVYKYFCFLDSSSIYSEVFFSLVFLDLDIVLKLELFYYFIIINYLFIKLN